MTQLAASVYALRVDRMDSQELLALAVLFMGFFGANQLLVHLADRLPAVVVWWPVRQLLSIGAGFAGNFAIFAFQRFVEGLTK